MTDLSRRQLLSGAASGAAVLLGSSVVNAKESPLGVCKIPAKWDETYDLVVVGSGGAGLASAVMARQQGVKRVLVLEKMGSIGGNSVLSDGQVAVPGTAMQKYLGIKDSPELLAKDMMVAGLYMNQPAKVKLVADNALSNYEWTVKELGVEYNLEAIGQEGGHSVPRYVFTKNGSGSGIVSKELEKLKKMGVPVRLRCYVERIFRDDSGRVVGIQIREGYRFPKKDSGKVKFIAARKGVVLCYGGFSADVKFRQMHDPKLTDKFSTTNQPGATGELWRETYNIGCAQIQNDWIQCGPWSTPKEKGMGIGWQFNQTAAAEYGIWVNSKGDRFVNELANRKVRADAIMVEQQNGLKAFAICNEPNVQPLKKQRPGFLEKMLDAKILDKYDTVEAMAKGAGIPLDELKKTIAAFNEAVKTKKDPAFGRYINNDQVPMVDGPWYIGECQPKVHHCMGGLYTDLNCQVIDVRNDKPIPGLYAAGESTSGVHGAVRLGSVAILDCLVFGRIAGQKAAKA